MCFKKSVSSYTGIDSIPTFLASDVEVLDEDGDGYADLVYALGARTSERTVFIADIAPVRTDMVDGEPVVTMEAFELVDGELVETTFAIEGWWAPEGRFAPLGINGVGLYEITESDDGFTWFVSREIPVERVASVTSDGNRVFVGPAGSDEYVVLDGAEVFKFEGTWVEVADVTEDDEWTKADLDTESLIFIQENEDGDVVAVYDMWILLNVIDESNVANEPVIYAGKTVGDVDLVLSLPAHTSYEVTSDGQTVAETAADAHDCDDHTYCNAVTETIALDGQKFFRDIVVTTGSIDLHKHIRMAPAADAKCVTAVDGTARTISVDVSEYATYTVADLLADLKAGCEHVKSIVVKDNTGAVMADLTTFVGMKDITVVAVAENGAEFVYAVEITGAAADATI